MANKNVANLARSHEDTSAKSSNSADAKYIQYLLHQKDSRFCIPGDKGGEGGRRVSF